MGKSLVLWVVCCFFFLSMCLIRTTKAAIVITGHTTPTTSRILIDRGELPVGSVFQVAVFDEGNERHDLVIRRLVLTDVPQVVHLEDLVPSHKYRVEFIEFDADLTIDPDATPSFVMHSVFFRTPSVDQRTPLKIVVVSCDRFLDSDDDSHWINLILDQRRSNDPEQNSANLNTHDVMFHLGDQIYADRIVKTDPLNWENATLTELISVYRNYYRQAFGRRVMRPLLRNGIHYMIMDDHDILNDVSRNYFDRKPEHALVVAAGRIAFLEFQNQLMYDLPEDYLLHIEKSVPLLLDNNTRDLAQQHLEGVEREKAYSFVRLGRVGIVNLDLRYERTFYYDENFPLTGERQMTELKQVLKMWDKDDTLDVILVNSAVPLVFYDTIATAITANVIHEFYPAHESYGSNTVNLIDMLFQQKKLSLMSAGDVHMFAATEVCNSRTGRCIDQLITSGMTSESTTLGGSKALHVLLNHFLVTKVWPRSSTHHYYWQHPELEPNPNAPTSFVGAISEFLSVDSRTLFFGPNYGTIRVAERYPKEVTYKGWTKPLDTMETWQIIVQSFVDQITLAFSCATLVIICIMLFRLVSSVLCRRNKKLVNNTKKEKQA